VKLKLVIPVALLGVAAAVGVALLLWPKPHSNVEQWAVVKKYCFECHNYTEMAGNQAFDKMSPDVKGELPNSPGRNGNPINDQYYRDNYNELYADNQKLFERH